MLKVLINTFKILTRKKGFLVLSIILPAVLTIFFSYVFGQQGVYRVGIVNKDKGIISNSVLEKVEDIDGIKIEYINEKEVENLLSAKELEIAIIVNEEFTNNILSGKVDTIEVKSISESDVKPVILGIINSETSNLKGLAKLAKGNEVKFKELQDSYNSNMPEYNLSDNKEKAISVMSSVGIIIMMIFISGQIITRFIIDDEINGTKARTLLSGISEKSYYGGVITVFYICSALTSIVYYVMCKALGFNFGLDNSIYFLIVLLLVNMLSITFNLCIVSCVKKPSLAINVSILFIMPTTMLGGAFWSFEMMPEYMQKIGNLTPQRWAIGAIEKMQEGSSLIDVMPMLLAIVMLSVALFLLSIFFSTRVEKAKC